MINAIELTHERRIYVFWYEGKQYQVAIHKNKMKTEYVLITYTGQISSWKPTNEKIKEIKKAVVEYLNKNDVDF